MTDNLRELQAEELRAMLLEVLSSMGRRAVDAALANGLNMAVIQEQEKVGDDVEWHLSATYDADSGTVTMNAKPMSGPQNFGEMLAMLMGAGNNELLYRVPIAWLPESEHGGRKEFARELDAILFPERYPPGTDGHDPDHVFWDGVDLGDPAAVKEATASPFQWDAETIEWVAQYVAAELGVAV